jgi:radical SAM superfamily enzyme YgiQ (UPF0313 family)
MGARGTGDLTTVDCRSSTDRSLRAPGAVLLISCYELGHQPMALAEPLGVLESAGYRPEALDIAVEPLEPEKLARARFVGIAVPMHTALRLGVRVARRVRELDPKAVVCFYGLYAALNRDYLLNGIADYCIDGEHEPTLLTLLDSAGSRQKVHPPNGVAEGREPQSLAAQRPGVYPPNACPPYGGGGPNAQRSTLNAPVPSRGALPPLERYARLEHRGESRVAGYVEATRGCAHRCTHCPIPPVYGGRFVVVPRDTVLEDVRRQVRAGARHITFGDPDFLNGPGHSLRIVRAVNAEFPELTWDFTAKIEHLLERRGLFPEFAALGCLFVVSAVESLSDQVLRILDKGHTRADVAEALAVVRDAGITLRPTWVPFTPWASRADFLEILDFVETSGLIDCVDPVQFTIRLLVPPGSLLAARPEMQPHLGRLDPADFSYRWAHPDPEMDRLQREVAALVEADARSGADPALTFYRIRALARRADPQAVSSPLPAARARPPRLTEPWFC